MAPERRPMSGKQGLEARNQQAARDALRRRQKAKKARTVKRHVRYKDRKKLLEEATANEAAAPIVAPELGTMGFSESEEDVEIETKHPTTNSKESGIAGFGEATGHGHASAGGESELFTGHDVVETDGIVGGPTTEDTEPEGSNSRVPAKKEKKEKKEKKKYGMFTKQVKQYQKAKREREEAERKRQERIKIREGMLNKSKKERKKQSKQFRKKTAKGQPVLKHKLDAMLLRIQKQ